MSSPTILVTTHCWWVQIALKALKSPWVGWVTTTFSLVKIFPPPTGISEVLAIGPLEVVPPEPPALSELPPAEPPEPHAASRGTPTPSPTNPPITARREASPPRVGLSMAILNLRAGHWSGVLVAGSTYVRDPDRRCCPLV